MAHHPQHQQPTDNPYTRSMTNDDDTAGADSTSHRTHGTTLPRPLSPVALRSQELQSPGIPASRRTQVNDPTPTQANNSTPTQASNPTPMNIAANRVSNRSVHRPSIFSTINRTMSNYLSPYWPAVLFALASSLTLVICSFWPLSWAGGEHKRR